MYTCLFVNNDSKGLESGFYSVFILFPLKLSLRNKAQGMEAGHKCCIEPLQEQKQAERRLNLDT